MPALTWHDIRQEYEADVIGSLILAEARRAVVSASRHYDPKVYTRTSDWADAIDDTVQQLVVDLLIGDGQIDYMVSVSRDLDGFRSLMSLQVRRLLARTRTRTVVDNLIERARDILRQPPFEQRPHGRRQEVYSLPGAQLRSPSRDEVWRAARRVALVPRVGVGHSERAPLVYSEPDLRALLIGVADDLGCQFALGDVDAILRLVLTDFLPRVLESDGAASAVSAENLSAEEGMLINEAVEAVMESLDADQRTLLREKLAGVSDTEMAVSRSVSRPTLAARKQAVFVVLERHLAELERALQVAVLDRLGLILVTGGSRHE